MLNARQRRAAAARREVAELIADYGITPAEVLLNVHRTTVQRWLDGVVPPPEAVLVALRAALGRLPGMRGRQWSGWAFGADGRLYSPAGYAYSAGDLLAQPYERAQVKALRERLAEVEARLARATQGSPAANDGDLSVSLPPR